MITKRIVAVVAYLAAANLLALPSIAEAQKKKKCGIGHNKPNIIVILADDVGKDVSNLYHAQTQEPNFPETAPTPSLADLADQGVMFTNGWAMPACSITRGTRTMGLLPSSSGMGGILGSEERTPHSSDDTILFPPFMVDPSNPDLIQARVRDAGYRTYKIGKWHETQGDDAERIQDILDSGFDKFYGQAGAMPELFFGYGGDNVWRPDNSIGAVPTLEFMTSALVTRAIEFIEEDNDKPYYLALDFAAAHWIYEVAPGPDEPPPIDNPNVDWRTLDETIHADVIEQVKAAFADDFGGDYPPAGTSFYKLNTWPSEAKRRAAFKSLIAYMDVQIGRLMEHVDLSNTYVIFAGDNGTQGNFAGSNFVDVVEAPEDPDESKTTLYHNGVNVPFLVAGPCIKQQGRASDAPVTTTDIYATVLDLIGVKQPKETRFDSMSFASVLRDDDDNEPKRKFNVAEQYLDTPAVGGTTITPGLHGRVISDGRYRLIARAAVETKSEVVVIDGVEYPVQYDVLACIPNNPNEASYGPDCTSDNPIGFVLNSQSEPVPVFNPDYNFFQTEINGRLQISLKFYDTDSDPAEDNNLLASPADMSPSQKEAFYAHCAYMNKVSRNANFYLTDKKTCDPPEGL